MRTLNALMTLALIALIAGACTEDAARVCTTDQQCADKAAAGTIDQSWTKCYPEGYCSKRCDGDADCKPPFWKEGLVCDTSQNICVAGTPSDGGQPDQPVADAGPDGGDASVDAEGDTMPPDTLKPDTFWPHGTACTPQEASNCVSGFCIDGVCCEKDGCGACQRCNVSGTEGACANADAVGDAAGDCAGADGACDGQCKSGACDWPTTRCEATCSTGTPTQLDQKFCASGACQPGAPAPCAAHTLCVPNAGADDTCPAGCVTHADCAESSAGAGDNLCDRTNAHVTGLGTCVDPTKVTRITTNAQLTGYLGAPGGNWGKVQALAGSAKYSGNYTIDKDIKLIADGAVSFRPSSAGPAFKVDTGGALTLQGIEILDAFDTNATTKDGDGILCVVTGVKPPLVVVESTISGVDHVGISVTNCSLTLRRSTIQGNDGGGLDLSKGTFVITNSLLYDNGSPSAAFGGATISSPIGVPVIFEHNTVEANRAGTGGTAGVDCSLTTYHLKHSIIAGSGTLVSKCLTTGSQLGPNACTLSGSKPTLPACLDTTATTTLTLDRDSGPRVKGSGLDLGCYEVQ